MDVYLSEPYLNRTSRSHVAPSVSGIISTRFNGREVERDGSSNGVSKLAFRRSSGTYTVAILNSITVGKEVVVQARGNLTLE